METQPEPTLVEFVRYNQWANQQLLAACMNLDEGLLTAGIPGAYGSILETFGHLLRAEAGFLKRIHGTGPQPAFKWEEGQSLADLLNQFYDYTQPEYQDFREAVAEFKERVPDLARGLADKIQAAHQDKQAVAIGYAAGKGTRPRLFQRPVHSVLGTDHVGG